MINCFVFLKLEHQGGGDSGIDRDYDLGRAAKESVGYLRRGVWGSTLVRGSHKVGHEREENYKRAYLLLIETSSML